MKLTIRFCDLCWHDYFRLKFAIGFYTTEDGKSWDVCPKHEKEVFKYGFKTSKFLHKGDCSKLEEATNSL